jgi:hypothetical protein
MRIVNERSFIIHCSLTFGECGQLRELVADVSSTIIQVSPIFAILHLLFCPYKTSLQDHFKTTANLCNPSFRYVTLQLKTSRLVGQSEILVLCDSVLQELSTNIQSIQYYNTIIFEQIWPFECSES